MFMIVRRRDVNRPIGIVGRHVGFVRYFAAAAAAAAAALSWCRP